MSAPRDAAIAVMNAAPAEYVQAVNAAAQAVLDAPDAVDRQDRRDDFSAVAGAAWNASRDDLRQAYVTAYNAAAESPVNVFLDMLDAGVFPQSEVVK